MKMDVPIEKNNSYKTGTILLDIISKISWGALKVKLPDKTDIIFSGTPKGVVGKIVILDWRMADLILKKGDIGAAESFVAGYWTSPDLSVLLQVISRNRDVLSQAVHGSWKDLLIYRFKDLLRRNTLRGSKKNIHDHYDIGNAFYENWLDKTMTYSSGIFSESEEKSNLTEAQIAKYERIIKVLGIKGQQTILEIGSGWGGFAIHCASKKNVNIDGITISNEQFNYSQKKIKKAGLGEKINIKLQDYRKTKGYYDLIVSIEMFEAVGENYWKSYFSTVKNNLKPNGRALIQTIVIKDDLYLKYKKSTDFIRQYIFPGGALPSISVFKKTANICGLNVVGEFAFGKDYAKTIQFWLASYSSNLQKLNKLGFDERFHRLWLFYLSYCQAGFRIGDVDVVQFELAKI